MTDESTVRCHLSHRTVNIGLLRTFQQSQAQGNSPSLSDDAKFRISSARLFKRNSSPLFPSNPVVGPLDLAIRALHAGLADMAANEDHLGLLLTLARVEAARLGTKAALRIYFRALEVWRDAFQPVSSRGPTSSGLSSPPSNLDLR
ncbi:unnamed protein product [Protopolystoma xenopodis]|uniref:Uncharacterized protein n=1 Tax=Protopolystoma xenopodis TaxID=117903 RepID=A0A3S5A5U9_9PLAT|nr:unnamed protein product [Protopolystoma xenopodis]